MADNVRRILIVEPSRVVRATLAKHLRQHFDVREEADGESAWQTLILDPFVVAVVCGPQPERLSGFDLLTRIRASKIRRIRDVDFLLIVSDSESEQNKQLAREKGVADFIARGMSPQEILAIVSRLGRWDPTRDKATAAAIPAPAPAIPPREPAGSWEKLTADLKETHGATSPAIGVLAFGLDQHAALLERFGTGTTTAIGERITRVLREKIGPQDSVVANAEADCCIISPGNTPATCIAFARRVCRSLASSEVKIRGTAFKLVVSAGVACTPVDGSLSREALIALATQRLAQARQHGGNRIVASDTPEAG